MSLSILLKLPYPIYLKQAVCRCISVTGAKLVYIFNISIMFLPSKKQAFLQSWTANVCVPNWRSKTGCPADYTSLVANSSHTKKTHHLQIYLDLCYSLRCLILADAAKSLQAPIWLWLYYTLLFVSNNLPLNTTIFILNNQCILVLIPHLC